MLEEGQDNYLVICEHAVCSLRARESFHTGTALGFQCGDETGHAETILALRRICGFKRLPKERLEILNERLTEMILSGLLQALCEVMIVCDRVASLVGHEELFRLPSQGICDLVHAWVDDKFQKAVKALFIKALPKNRHNGFLDVPKELINEISTIDSQALDCR